MRLRDRENNLGRYRYIFDRATMVEEYEAAHTSVLHGGYPKLSLPPRAALTLPTQGAISIHAFPEAASP